MLLSRSWKLIKMELTCKISDPNLKKNNKILTYKKIPYLLNFYDRWIKVWSPDHQLKIKIFPSDTWNISFAMTFNKCFLLWLWCLFLKPWKTIIKIKFSFCWFTSWANSRQVSVCVYFTELKKGETF